jgi:hypothetical protein
MTSTLKICMNYTAHLKLTKTGDYVISSKRRYTIILYSGHNLQAVVRSNFMISEMLMSHIIIEYMKY